MYSFVANTSWSVANMQFEIGRKRHNARSNNLEDITWSSSGGLLRVTVSSGDLSLNISASSFNLKQLYEFSAAFPWLLSKYSSRYRDVIHLLISTVVPLFAYRPKFFDYCPWRGHFCHSSAFFRLGADRDHFVMRIVFCRGIFWRVGAETRTARSITVPVTTKN